ncbi:MAG: hypothetical protein QFB87_05600 [Patescibacteria group bacterium]|nr:hypothetical protein [Patescibacteria group bacterium]
MNNLEIKVRRTLVLSTGHLDQDTMDCAFSLKNWISDFEYGAYFTVGNAGEVTPFEDPEDYPADLYACLLFAKQHGCDEVKFDADGPVVEGLNVYDW